MSSPFSYDAANYADVSNSADVFHPLNHPVSVEMICGPSDHVTYAGENHVTYDSGSTLRTTYAGRHVTLSPRIDNSVRGRKLTSSSYCFVLRKLTGTCAVLLSSRSHGANSGHQTTWTDESYDGSVNEAGEMKRRSVEEVHTDGSQE